MFAVQINPPSKNSNIVKSCRHSKVCIAMETKLKRAYAVKNNLQVTVKGKFIRITPLMLKDKM